MTDSKKPTMAAVTESLLRSAKKYGIEVEVVKQKACDFPPEVTSSDVVAAQRLNQQKS